MAYTIESSTICSIKAVTENGDSLVMSGVTTERKGYYKVHEMNGRHNTNSWYSQYHIKNSVSTMNTELVKVLRFDPLYITVK